MEFSKFDIKMFNRAREVAETSDFGRFHLGCVITYKHHILATASNSNKTHPMQKYYNKYRHFNKGSRPCTHTIHAEIAALNSIPYAVGIQIDWKEVNVYVYRIANGLPDGHGMARPCEACMAALANLGIRNIYYSTNTGFAYERLDH